MGIKSRDWESIGNYVSQMKAEGLSYKEGAKRFGLKESDIYEYNKRFKKSSFERSAGKVRNWTRIGEYVSRIEELGMSYVDGAAHFGVSVSSIYKYNSQIKKKKHIESVPGKSDIGGTDGASISSKAATSVESPAAAVSSGIEGSVSACAGNVRNVQLPPGVAELIINYRQEHPEHGYKRIEDHLKNRYFVVVPRKKIREVLKSHGLIANSDSSFDSIAEVEGVKGSRRFEASYPRELYQMDITYVYLVNQTPCYLVVVLDDNSRFCVSCELRRDYLGISMIEVLHRAIERYGKPSKLLTDQGSSFYSWGREQTLFSRYLDDMKIEHIVADPHSPQTLGKVERFHQTIQRELLKKSHFVSYEEARQRIESYMHHYNYERPHQGIDGVCPASRFQGIIGETSRIESKLCDSGIDFSRGYLVFKMYEHTISIVSNGGGLQVFLDGDLLQRGPDAVVGDAASKAN
jgi:transposase InsO family protein/transposase